MPNKSNKAKRLAIFLVCAPFASKILGSKEQLYLCPICGKHYPKESAKNGELTLEDVPPQSMRGTGLLLTCKTCNSQAGYKIDAHIKNQLDLQNFYQIISGNNTTTGKQISSNLLINDESFPVRIS
ncbi:MAG TPA: hypothetical protein VMT73_06530, partial [Anaerolineales bacterium]|nr:hypothetical protein [Anaerolineales bacterium]